MHLGSSSNDYGSLTAPINDREDILILMLSQSLDSWDHLPKQYKTDELAVKIALTKSDKLFYPWEDDPPSRVFELFKAESEKGSTNATAVFGYVREGFLYKYLTTFTCKNSLFENVKLLLLMTAGPNFTEGQQMAICLDIIKFCYELNALNKDISIHLLLDVIALLNLPLVEKKDFKEWDELLKKNIFRHKKDGFLKKSRHKCPTICVDSYIAQAKLENLSYIFYGFTQSLCWQSSVNSKKMNRVEEKFVTSLISKNYFNGDLKKNREFQESFFNDFSKLGFLFPLNQDKDDEEFIYKYFLNVVFMNQQNSKTALPIVF